MKRLAAFVGGAAFMALVILMLVGCASTKRPVRSSNSARTDLMRVYFATNSDELDDEALETLEVNRTWLKSHARAVLVLEGHCDERGDDAYNLQLGDRRARQVKGYLIAAGVDPERLIMVVSHGERRPIDPRHNEDAWRQNRRVEFIIR